MRTIVMNSEEKTAAILDKLSLQIQESLPGALSSCVIKWVGQFLSTIALEDLEDRSSSDLYGAALSFWRFNYVRKPGELKLRVYNPEFERDGWISTHTVVEVVTEDVPFLVESIVMELNKRGITSHLIMYSGGIHAIRDENAQIVDVQSAINASVEKSMTYDAPILIEIDKQTDEKVLQVLQASLEKIICEVQAAVSDWGNMRALVKDAIKRIKAVASKIPEPEVEESIAFLEWIEDNNFTFIGARDYKLIETKNELVLEGLCKSGLGVLRENYKDKSYRYLSSMTPEARSLALSTQILFISKTNTVSTIHRPTYTDYIGIKLFDDDGNVVGERRIIGLFTSMAYNTNPSSIPLLRGKVKGVMKKSGVHTDEHSGKMLKNILDTLPRDDLFQATQNELLDICMGIFHLQERKRIKLFVRKDIHGKFISCLVYVPRDRFDTELRKTFQELLLKEFDGKEINFFTHFSDSVLTRIHFVIRASKSDADKAYDTKSIEKKLIIAARSWSDELCDNLLDHYGEETGNTLSNKYRNSFPVGYREQYSARTAVNDISHLEKLNDSHRLELNFYKPIDDVSDSLRFKIFRVKDSIPLSDVIPILENMGLRIICDQPFEIKLSNGSSAWINDFGMLPNNSKSFDVSSVKDLFQECFRQVWFGAAECDKFNNLVLNASLNWKEIAALRSYAKYLQQIGFQFSQSYIEETMTGQMEISKELMDLFHNRFNPKISKGNEEVVAEIKDKIIEKINSVSNLDEDRILRRFLDLIMATIRTNYYQVDKFGNSKSYISFKLDPQLIPDIPLPVPMFEVFVYSPRFEGVHLRSAKVARGGLRWSDRREDFRVEILGLMKAQVVKNAVIVPAGAKGGFYPKCLPSDGSREEIYKEGVACYQNFIRGLLDITDNQINGQIVPPDNVVRYDEDDPYLVVAADKGTATFSDIANEISREYQFWLDDAFASGGSTGYDHKKIGITARGAWESVKRHFRELDHNTQETPFTVIGIGDMAGDVFGNGMLLSDQIKLVAAFNHLHIFIDPDPDPGISFKERQRLFELPRSSWSDYDKKCLSKGGGIFSRQDKSIKLSKEAQKALGIEVDKIIPNDLIKSILQSPVDLLWNGGIGTFVKSINESHLDVGDRANDSIRINASQLRCRVVGEGGNLGCTQRARMEYALNDGYIYSDFIDNAAGVDCSDHEVNIKILLNDALNNGDMTEKQRNELLAKMTDEVADLVLKNNYDQTQAVSLAAAQAISNFELHSRYIDHMEQSGKLNRELEFIPDHKAMLERKQNGVGLGKPALSVLLAYAKIDLKEGILNSDIPEDPFFFKALEQEFPVPLRNKYTNYMAQHSLRREIIATQLSNDMVNEMGFAFVNRLHDETGAPIPAIVRAYAASREIFGVADLWQVIDSLDNKISSDAQHSMLILIVRLMRRSTRWFLRHRRQSFDVDAIVAAFKPTILKLQESVADAAVGSELAHYEEMYRQLASDKVIPEHLARTLASTRVMQVSLEIADATQKHELNIERFMKIYFAVGEHLNLSWMRGQVISHSVGSYWEGLSREALRDDMDWQQRQLSIGIYQFSEQFDDVDEQLAAWSDKYQLLINRWQEILSDIRAAESVNFTMFFVAIRELLDLTQTCLQNN